MGIDALFGFFGRAAATALVVVLASVIAEAAGPVLGALAASLPVSAGPTYVFLALTHDTSFVSASAVGQLRRQRRRHRVPCSLYPHRGRAHA